jgi:hypothetical protein
MYTSSPSSIEHFGNKTKPNHRSALSSLNSSPTPPPLARVSQFLT